MLIDVASKAGLAAAPTNKKEELAISKAWGNLTTEEED